MIDSQAVKNTCNAGIESKGFCFYKCTNGIKRHLAVDILGFPFFTHCTKAAGRVTRHAVSLMTKVWLKCSSTTSIISKLNLLSYPRRPSCWTTAITLRNWLKPWRKFTLRLWPRFNAGRVTRHALNSLLNHPKRRKRQKDNLDLCLLRLDGSSNAQTLGWRDAKAWSKISTAHLNVPMPNSSSVLLGWCSKDWPPQRSPKRSQMGSIEPIWDLFG